MVYSQIDIATNCGLEGVALGVGVRTPGEKKVFDSFGVVGCADPNVVGLPGVPDEIPQLVSFAAVFKVELETALFTPARSRDD